MGVSRMVLSRTALALLRQMSMPPNRAIVAATAASTCSSSRISQTSGSARPPASSICRAAVPIVPGSEGCGSDVLAAIAILAPSRAARSATARPIPREPPLMKIVFPASVAFIRAFPQRAVAGVEQAQLEWSFLPGRFCGQSTTNGFGRYASAQSSSRMGPKLCQRVPSNLCIWTCWIG